MTRQATPEEQAAFKRLENDRYVLGFIQDLLADERDRLMVTRDEAELRIAQGRAQAYTQMLRLINPEAITGKRR